MPKQWRMTITICQLYHQFTFIWSGSFASNRGRFKHGSIASTTPISAVGPLVTSTHRIGAIFSRTWWCEVTQSEARTWSSTWGWCSLLWGFGCHFIAQMSGQTTRTMVSNGTRTDRTWVWFVIHSTLTIWAKKFQERCRRSFVWKKEKREDN